MSMKVKRKDSGLASLIMIANYYEISITKKKLQEDFAIEKKLSDMKIVQIAREIGLKAKYKTKETFKNMKKYQLPLLVKTRDEEYIFITSIGDEELITYDPVIDEHRRGKLEDFYNYWTEEVIMFKPIDKTKKKEKFSLKWFVKPLLKYKRGIVETLITIFMIQILGIVFPLIMQVIIDKVLVHNSLNTLNVLAMALGMIIIFESILGTTRTYIFSNITSKVDIILGISLFKHLVNLPIKYFENRRAGDTLSRVREIENVRQFITGAPLTAILDVMFLFIYLLVMAHYSQKLTLIILLSMVIYVILSILVIPIFKKMLNEVYEKGADENACLIESINGIKTIKSLALEPKNIKKWSRILSDYVRSNFKLSVFGEIIDQFSDLIRKGFDLAVLYFGVMQVINGKMSIGGLIAFRMLSSKVTGPVLKIVGMWQNLNQINVSVEKIADIFNTSPELKSGDININSFEGDIKFKDVSFKYGIDKPNVIKKMSFKIEKGNVIGIVGRSGSGKSTVSKLIQRLYEVGKGTIYIDEHDISTIDPSSLRRNIGVVLQDNFLFKGTIDENIKINKVGATREDVIKASKLAGAHEFIMDLPDKYNTLLGENGIGLSGGQKQRIAIARTLISDPKILILDEATSALDYESESMIQKNLDDICKDKTVIIIAHRLSTVKDADKIMVLEEGEVVEYDTPKNLLESKGEYYNLYSMQQGGVN